MLNILISIINRIIMIVVVGIFIIFVVVVLAIIIASSKQKTTDTLIYNSKTNPSKVSQNIKGSPSSTINTFVNSFNKSDTEKSLEVIDKLSSKLDESLQKLEQQQQLHSRVLEIIKVIPNEKSSGGKMTITPSEDKSENSEKIKQHIETIIKKQFEIILLNLQNIILQAIEKMKQDKKESNLENVSDNVKNQIIEHLRFLAPDSHEQSKNSELFNDLVNFMQNQQQLSSPKDQVMKELTPLLQKLNTQQNSYFKEVIEALSKGIKELKNQSDVKTIELNSSMKNLFETLAAHELEKDAATTQSMFEFLNSIASNQSKLEDLLINGHALEAFEPTSRNVYDPKYLEDLIFKYVESTTAGLNSQFKKSRAEYDAMMGQLVSIDNAMRQLYAFHPSVIANLPPQQPQQPQPPQPPPQPPFSPPSSIPPRPKRTPTNIEPVNELEQLLRAILTTLSASESNSNIFSNYQNLQDFEKINTLLERINSLLNLVSNSQLKRNPNIDYSFLETSLQSLEATLKKLTMKESTQTPPSQKQELVKNIGDLIKGVQTFIQQNKPPVAQVPPVPPVAQVAQVAQVPPVPPVAPLQPLLVLSTEQQQLVDEMMKRLPNQDEMQKLLTTITNIFNQQLKEKDMNIAQLSASYQELLNQSTIYRDSLLLATTQIRTEAKDPTVQEGIITKLKEELQQRQNTMFAQYNDYTTNYNAATLEFNKRYNLLEKNYFEIFTVLSKYERDHKTVDGFMNQILEDAGMDSDTFKLPITEKIGIIRSWASANSAESIAQLKVFNDEVQKRNEKYKQDNLMLNREVEILKNTLDAFKQKGQDDEGKIEMLELKVAELEGKISELQTTIEYYKDQLSTLENYNAMQSAEIQKLRRDTEELRKENVLNQYYKNRYNHISTLFNNFKQQIASIKKDEQSMFMAEMGENVKEMATFINNSLETNSSALITIDNDLEAAELNAQLTEELRLTKLNLDEKEKEFTQQIVDFKEKLQALNEDKQNDRTILDSLLGYLYAKTYLEGSVNGTMDVEFNTVKENLKAYVGIAQNESAISEAILFQKVIETYLQNMKKRMAEHIKKGYIEQFQQSKDEFDQANNELTKELQNVNTQLQNQTTINQSNQSTIAELTSTIADLNAKIRTLQETNSKEIKKLENSAADQANTITEQTSEIKSKDIQIEELQEQVLVIELQLSQYTTFLTQLNSKLGIPENEPFNIETSLNALNTKLQKLEELETYKAESENRINELQKHIQLVEDKNKELEETLKRIFPDPEEEEAKTTTKSLKLNFNTTIQTVDRLFRYYENKLGFIPIDNYVPTYKDGSIKEFLSHLIQFMIKYKHFDIGSFEAKTNNFKLYKSPQRVLPFVMVIKDFNPKDVGSDILKDFYTNSPTQIILGDFNKKYTKLFSIRKKSDSLEVLNQYTKIFNLVEFFVSTDFIQYNIQYPYVQVADMGNKQYYKCTHTFKDMKHFHLIFESNIAYYIQMLQKKADFEKITSESQQPLALKGGEISRKPSPLLAKNYQKYVSILENVSYVMGIKYIRYLYYKKYKTSRSIQIENFCVSMMLSTVVYYIENYYLFELMTIDLIFSTLLFECTKNENTLLLPFFSPFLFID
jgi:hypothetical protein